MRGTGEVLYLIAARLLLFLARLKEFAFIHVHLRTVSSRRRPSPKSY